MQLVEAGTLDLGITCIHSAVGTTNKFLLAHDIGKFHVDLVINNAVNELGLGEETCE